MLKDISFGFHGVYRLPVMRSLYFVLILLSP